jgi:hypothetical protein
MQYLLEIQACRHPLQADETFTHVVGVSGIGEQLKSLEGLRLSAWTGRPVDA